MGTAALRKERLELVLEHSFRREPVVAAVLEDTATTGGSLLAAVDAEGGKVTRALCIVDRCEGAEQAVAQRGLTLETLLTRADLPL
jgi:orotate phosphoribosyltransferase